MQPAQLQNTDITNTTYQSEGTFTSKAWWQKEFSIYSTVEGTLSVDSESVIFRDSNGQIQFELKIVDVKTSCSPYLGGIKFYRNPDGKYDVFFFDPRKIAFGLPGNSLSSYISPLKYYDEAVERVNECGSVLQLYTRFEPFVKTDPKTSKNITVILTAVFIIAAVLIVCEKIVRYS